MTDYFIHDLDDNLQRFKADCRNYFNKAAVQAAREDCGIDVSENDVINIIQESIATVGDWFGLLVKRYEIDFDLMHLSYNRRISRDVIVPFGDLPVYFEVLGDRAQHCLLTHAHRDWAVDSLSLNGIKGWFGDRIIGLEDYKDEPKNKGPLGYRKALDRLGVLSSRGVFFTDDTLANHVEAKKTGLTTVWSSHGRELPAAYKPYVDYAVTDVRPFLRQRANDMGLNISRLMPVVA